MTFSRVGKDIFSGWMQDEYIAIITYNDSIRPISFKIEATDKDAETF